MEPKVTIFTLILSLGAFLAPGLYGILGSAGFYIHEIIQDPESFSCITLCMYAFLGFMIATMFYNFPEIANVTHSAGFLIAAGFSVRKITEMSDKIVGIGVKLPKK